MIAALPGKTSANPNDVRGRAASRHRTNAPAADREFVRAGAEQCDDRQKARPTGLKRRLISTTAAARLRKSSSRSATKTKKILTACCPGRMIWSPAWLAQTDGSVMAMISEFKDLFGEWIAAVARAVDTVAGRFLRSRQILLARRQGRHGGGQGDLGAKSARRCPTCRFVWTRAGPPRHCRRTGRRPFAAVVSKPCCNPIRSCSRRSTFQVRPAIFSMA